MKQLQITLKYKLMLTNLKIELHLKLRQYYIELLSSKTMKVLGSIEKRIIKDRNGETIPH